MHHEHRMSGRRCVEFIECRESLLGKLISIPRIDDRDEVIAAQITRCNGDRRRAFGYRLQNLGDRERCFDSANIIAWSHGSAKIVSVIVDEARHDRSAL